MYGLHMDGPNGPSVRYAQVGDRIWHVWDCPSDVYGMLVHSCYVLDGQGNEVQIIDEHGLATLETIWVLMRKYANVYDKFAYFSDFVYFLQNSGRTSDICVFIADVR
jgi:hypothetical protein